MSVDVSEVFSSDTYAHAKVGGIYIEVEPHVVRDPAKADEYAYVHDGRWSVRVYTDELSCGGNCGYSNHHYLADYIMGDRDAAAIVATRWAFAALPGGTA